MLKVKDHCKGCVLFSKHKTKDLTEAQKKHDNWCCAKGQAAAKSLAYCVTHNLKKVA